MNAKKCDRCGKFYEGTSKIYDSFDNVLNANEAIIDGVGVEIESIGYFGPHVTNYRFDLCENCLQRFIDFMKMEIDEYTTESED